MAIQDDKNIPKSRVTLRYRTEIHGTPEDITLPFRLLVVGDFSGKGGESDDEGNKLVLEQRQIFDASRILELKTYSDSKTYNGKSNPIMKQLDVTDEDSNIPLRCLAAFSPGHLLEKGTSKTKTNLEVRRLLTQVLSNLSNNKRYREVMLKMLKDDVKGLEMLLNSYQSSIKL